MPTLYLIRGLPGSGKSYLAAAMADGLGNAGIVVEADQFFLSSNGHTETYRFDRRFLGAAHDESYGRTMRYLREGKSVMVANTFSTNRELSRYITGVERCGLKVDVQVIKCIGQYNSIHNVPRRAVEKMRDRWEEFDGETVFNGDLG